MAGFNSKDAPIAQDVTSLPHQNPEKHPKEVIKIMGESAHLFLPNDHQ